MSTQTVYMITSQSYSQSAERCSNRMVQRYISIFPSEWNNIDEIRLQSRFEFELTAAVMCGGQYELVNIWLNVQFAQMH